MDRVRLIPLQAEKLLVGLSAYSVPLYHVDHNDRTLPFGTGFFVLAEGTYFLVSAAHVLDRYAADIYYFSSPTVRRKLVGVGGASTSRAPTRMDDRIDVGVIRLPDEGVPPYPHVFDSAHLLSIFLPRAVRDYVLIGYPTSKNKKYSHAEKTAYVTPDIFTGCPPVPDGDYSKFGFRSDEHVLLRQDLGEGRTFDGRPQAFPSPRGMSGSPVCALLNASETQSKTPGFGVVGVFIEYRKAGRLFVASDIGWVVEAIRQLNEAAKAKWSDPPPGPDSGPGRG